MNQMPAEINTKTKSPDQAAEESTSVKETRTKKKASSTGKESVQKTVTGKTAKKEVDGKNRQGQGDRKESSREGG